MRVEISVNPEVNLEPELVVTIRMSSLDQDEIKGLMERAQKPLSENIGGTLVANDPLVAIELTSAYLIACLGGNPDTILTALRHGYMAAAIKMSVANLPQNVQDQIKNGLDEAKRNA
jgi:hypothetical protein